MQRIIVILLAVLLVAALLSYTVTYTVKFTETAVLTTFGRANEGAIKTEAGLYFKWPFPVQAVTKYDRRTRIVNTQLETAQTRDGSQIIVQGFATYRVSDPLKFFQRWSNAGERADEHFSKAEGAIRLSLRSALGATSGFSMGELFAATDAGSKLPELETEVLRLVRGAGVKTESATGAGATAGTGEAAGGGGTQSLADLGIEVTSVGVSRVSLPQETTQKVFERMGAQRDALVKEIESQGDSLAQAIRTRAESNAKKIESFALRRAGEIRALGDQEASRYVAQMNANPALAIFLREVEFLRTTVGRTTTVTLTTSMPGTRLLEIDQMDALLRAGVLPAKPELGRLPSAAPETRNEGVSR